MSDEEGDYDYDAEWGLKIGPWMKGALIDGDVLAWRVNKSGKPHHDEIDGDARRNVELSHTGPYMSMTGYGPPIQFISDILGWFTDYKNETEIEVGLEVGQRDAPIIFNFFGTIGQLRTFFKQHPPPDINDYEDEGDDIEFLHDYDKWTELPMMKKSVREILGRGGRDDNWQERDEDWSKGFSVYNPKKKKKRK